MRWRRLGWAGIEIESEGESIVVDHLLDAGLFKHFLGPEPDQLITPSPGAARAALLTHLHRDHADIAAIEAALAPGAPVLRPERKPLETKLDEIATGEAEAALEASAVAARAFRPGDTLAAGPFTITATAAVDGLGSPQVSWLIEAGGQRALHCGDTLWHATWWDLVATHGPVDLAWLPANGVEIAYPGWDPPVEVPAVLTPEQSVEAAYALSAGTLAPIHFSRMFEHTDFYRPATDARKRIGAAASRRGVDVCFPEPGEWLELG